MYINEIEEYLDNTRPCPVGHLDYILTENGEALGWTVKSVVELAQQMPFLIWVSFPSFKGEVADEFHVKAIEFKDLELTIERRVGTFPRVKLYEINLQFINISKIVEIIEPAKDFEKSTFVVMDKFNNLIDGAFMLYNELELPGAKQITAEEFGAL